HEIEEKRCITQGEESCWTVREDAHTTSFGVFHNGASTTPAQTVTLRVRRHDGEERTCAVEVPELAPFEMVTVEPAAHFSNLSAWLENRAGNARLSFKVSGAFTRMLCGVRRRDWRELQVTHSNFDYSTHETDKISEGNLTAYMRTPRMPQDVGHTELVVYPDSDPGDYRLTDDAGALSFQSPALVTRAYADAREKLAKFQRSDEVLPTRIVTAFRAQAGTGALPAECSLGVIHHKRPAKHFSWMLVSKAFDSSVNWVDFEEVYGGCPASAEVVFNLYSAASKSALTKTWTHEQLPSGKLMRLDEIFPDENVAGFLANDHGCLSAWSAYGGFMFFSTLRKHESLTIEHSF
ncbi:MAG: hypothetical protein JWP52_4037, partial [Rhizobacter sp.]|nr:hypothetical protein [Rhizobacter sp.]